MDRTSKFKINKKTEDLNNSVDETDRHIQMYTFYPTAAEYTFQAYIELSP